MDPQMDAQMGLKMSSEIDAKTGTPNGPQNELEKTTLICSPNGVCDLVSKLGGRKAQILERAGCYFTASDLCNFASSSCSCLLLLSPAICNFRLFLYLLLFPALSCYLLIFLAISLLLVVISCHLLLFLAISCYFLPFPAMSCWFLRFPGTAASCYLLLFLALSLD